MDKSIMISAYAASPFQGSEPGIGWSWVMGWIKAGYRVILITCSTNRSDIEKFTKNNVEFNSLRVVYIDIKSKKFPHASGPHYIAWQILALWNARKISKKMPIKLIHHVSYGSIHGASLLFKTRSKFIFGPVGGGQISPKYSKKYYGKKWIQEEMRTSLTKMLFYSPIHRKLASKSDLIIVSNEPTGEIMKKLGGKNIIKMIDTSLEDTKIIEKRAKFNDTTINLLWIGRLLPRKAAIMMLYISKKLSIKFKLKIVGDGPEMENLRQEYIEMGSPNNIEILGKVSWENVESLYRWADLHVFTSVRDTFGSQIIEAASQGLPTVMLPTGASAWLKNYSCGLVADDAVDEIASMCEMIEYFFYMPLDAKLDLSKNAIELAKRATIDFKIRQIESAIINNGENI